MGELAAEIAKDPENTELSNKYIEISAWAYLHEGAVSAAMKLMEESDTYISRQFVELKVKEWVSGMDYWQARTNQSKALWNLSLSKGEPCEKAWIDYLDARSNMYRNLGATQLHQQLIWTIDMRKVDYELHMEIIETDKNREKKIAPYRSMDQ